MQLSPLICVGTGMTQSAGASCGTGVALALHNQKVVGLNVGGALVVTGRFPQCTVTELSKAMLFDALSMGHCT